MDLFADRMRLERAVDALAHRGPDDRGLFVADDRRAFLGHRRLSIIDLTGGQQPIADETVRIHLCCNGEIYNHRELRAACEERGHVFRTRTDSESALHLYQDDAGGFVTRLNGMFAIAILDEDTGTLTLARDRHGIKPLYYMQTDDWVCFASELKAILELLPRQPALSATALQHYLRWKYIPPPLTVYEGIRELPPAHWMRVRRGDAGDRLTVECRPYWVAEFPERGDPAILADEREALEQLDTCVRAAVERHLESDVEVGSDRKSVV